MDETTVDGLANRDEAIPVVNLPYDLDQDTEDGAAPERKRDRFRKQATDFKENIRKRTSDTGATLQDRLLEKLLQQVIPTEDLSTNKEPSTSDLIERPSFNISTMSTNFRRFNARIGAVFKFQAKVIRLLSWKTASHTLSFLAVYTFICLDPYLVTVLPLIVIILALLVPAFITRHPAAPTTLTNTTAYSPVGPPLAPAATVKPVKELSRDFFRNMRDLQNSMEDFSRLHDTVIATLTPQTNFSNEALSSTLFLFCFATAGFMFIASHLMPWRLIFLLIGWAVVGLQHPAIQRQLASTHSSHIAPHSDQAASWLDAWIASDIILDSAPEVREVEIFELQHRSDTTAAGEWESFIFSPSPFDPLSEARIKQARPQGTRFFEDVAPPRGWEWSGAKWALDLWSREWVEERIITGVEVETEGERWVYDLNYTTTASENNNGTDIPEDTSPDVVTPTSRKEKAIKMKTLPSWEEASGDADGDGDGERGRRGKWRRRRWVRLVKRRSSASAAVGGKR